MVLRGSVDIDGIRCYTTVAGTRETLCLEMEKKKQTTCEYYSVNTIPFFTGILLYIIIYNIYNNIHNINIYINIYYYIICIYYILLGEISSKCCHRGGNPSSFSRHHESKLLCVTGKTNVNTNMSIYVHKSHPYTNHFLK